MAKSWYEITFADGSTERVEADDATAAKTQAKNARIAKVDPGRSMLRADLTKHDQVKVSGVTELTGDRLKEHQDRAGRRGDEDRGRDRQYRD